MRTRIIGRALSAAVLAALARAGTVRGQNGAGKLTVATEVGGRGFLDEPGALQIGKFQEYRYTPRGALLEQLLMRYTPADSFRLFQITARNAGQADQSAAFRAAQPGLFDVNLRWDRIPHTFSTNARSLGAEPSPGVFTLPNPRPDTGMWNRTSPYLAPVALRWNLLRASAGLTPSARWDFRAEYTDLRKKGKRPMGMAFGSPGSNLREVLEPIDQVTRDVKLAQGFATRQFQLMATYDLSLFHNAYESVTSDNPLLITDSPTGGSSRGRTSLAPNNVAQTGVVNAALNLPFRTRVNASGSYAWWKQDAQFIPVTINSAIADARIASLPTHLGGIAGTSAVSLAATSRPFAPLALSARVRTFSYRDRADVDSMAVFVVNDRSVSAGEERHRYPYTRTNADASASWRFNALRTTLSAGYAWDRWTRNQETRNVYRTREHAPRASIDVEAFTWLDLRGTYSKSWRRALDPYLQNTPIDLPEHRRFDQADRDRDRTNVLAIVTPLRALSFSANWTVGHDEYVHSAYGTQADRSTMLGGDVAWTPSTRISVDAGYSRENFLTRLRSRYRVTGMLDNLTYDWVANTRDRVSTATGGFSAILAPDRLEVGGRIDAMRSRFVMATYNPLTPTGGTAAQNLAATASDLPVVTQLLQPMTVYLRYRLRDEWAATVRYQTERYDQNDFRTLGLVPAEGNGIFLGNNFDNYDATFITLSISYHPQLLRIGRSVF